MSRIDFDRFVLNVHWKLRESVEAAHAAQFAEILTLTLARPRYGYCRIQTWNETLSDCVTFGAADLAKVIPNSTYDGARKRLVSLAKYDLIDTFPGGRVRYRLKAENCRCLAEMAIAYWTACGYRADRAVPRNIEREDRLAKEWLPQIWRIVENVH